MSVAALDLTDACLTLVVGTELVAMEEGCALVGPAGLVFGAEARARSKLAPLQFLQGYWRQLAETPLARPLPGYVSAVDVARAHLAHLQSLLPETSAGVILATPPYWDADQLALMLGLAQQSGMRVLGVVDGAVAAARRAHHGAKLFQLEATLDDLWLATIAQEEGATLAGRERAGEGVEGLRRRAASFFSRCFLSTSRFDPTHDAQTEQELHDRMRDWSEQLADEPEITVQIAHRGNQFAAVIRAADLAAHMTAAIEPLLRRLRVLGGPGGTAVLQVPAHVGSIPGLLESLAATAPLPLALLAPGEAARGALRLKPTDSAAGHRLQTSLPWDQPAVVPAVPEAGSARTRAAAPTHVLHGRSAYRLGNGPFHIGQELAAGEYGLTLAASVRGVSRRHCTIKEELGRVVLHDHSRFGTALNGHRIEGSAILQGGDRISIGQPPEEFILVTEVTPEVA